MEHTSFKLCGPPYHLSSRSTASDINIKGDSHNGQKGTETSTEPPTRYKAWLLSSWRIHALAALMVVLGVVIEILAALSDKNQGFTAPSTGIVSVGHVSLQASFLAAFAPTAFAFVLSLAWNTADTAIRWYQPYVAMAQGDARVEDCLLNDYVTSSRAISLFKSAIKREWIVHFSILTALLTGLYGPLAGALISVQTLEFHVRHTIFTRTTLGLNPQVSNPEMFLTAAIIAMADLQGTYTDSSLPIYNNNALPRVAQSSDPSIGEAIRATFWLTGVHSDTNCTSANVTLVAGNTTTIVAARDDCRAILPATSGQQGPQVGIASVDGETCGFDKNSPVSLLPVMFWYTSPVINGSLEAVLCRPTITVGHTSSLWTQDEEIDSTGQYFPRGQLSLQSTSMVHGPFKGPKNNVTGPPLNGRAYNGFFFSNTSGDGGVINTIQAPLLATSEQRVSNCSSSSIWLDEQKCRTDTFLAGVEEVYTPYLNLIAQFAYFVPAPSPVPGSGSLALLKPRFVINPLAAHSLSALLICIGLCGLVLQIVHTRKRQRVRLTNPPGTIAAVIALTARSGLQTILEPLDTEETIREKLKSCRFRLDPDTGGIVVDRYVENEKDASKSALSVKAPSLESGVIGGVDDGPGWADSTTALLQSMSSGQ